VATVELTQEMFQRTGAEPGDTEGLINYPRTICDVQAVALFRETADGRTKVSLRSRGSLDVERLSREEGGGGHKNAAGFTVDRALAEVRSRVLARLGEILD
jgi:phosphoesterase RecJ-like protein